MRLRLAMTNSAAEAASSPLPGQPPSAPTTASADATSSVINQIVWNSVLESLSTTMTSIASSLPQSLATVTNASSPGVPAVATAPGPGPSSIAPLAPPSVQNPSIASLFVPSPPADFSALPVAKAPEIAALHAPPQPAPAPPPPPVPQASAATNAPIAGSEVIVPAMPTLTPPSRAATAPKPATKVAFLEDGPANVALAKKKKRRPLRTLFSLLIVLALIGGAGYAGYYYYVLRKKVDWTADVQPLVEFVEQTTGRAFTTKVPVELVDQATFEARLGDHVLNRSYADPDGSFNTLRAVGLATGQPDATSAGHLAAAVMTSFYDPASKTIYALDGSTAAYQVSMIRSLTIALADQELVWSDQTAALTDSERVGFLALIDGVADRIVQAKFDQDPTLQSQSADEFSSRRTDAGITDEGLPFPVSSVINSIENGATLYPPAAADDPLEGLTPTSDAVVFDPTRSRSGTSAPVAGEDGGDSASRTLGMQFWFEALIPALGIDGARAAALLWISDDSVTTSTSHPCVQSLIEISSEQDQATLMAALTQWAASRPESSKATVTTEPNNHVMLSMCEPTEETTPPLSPPGSVSLYTDAEVERDFLAAMVAAGLPDTPLSRSCSVLAFRAGGAPNFEAGSTDETVQQAMTNVLNFCKGV
jgi:hypothetical protein